MDDSIKTLYSPFSLQHAIPGVRIRFSSPIIKILPISILKSLSNILTSDDFKEIQFRPQSGSCIVILKKKDTPLSNLKYLLEQSFNYRLNCFFNSEKTGSLIAQEDKWSTMTIHEVAKELKISLHSGLPSLLAQEKLQTDGLNIIPSKPPRSKWEIFIGQFKGLPIMILSLSAGVSLIMGGFGDAIVIFGVVFINSCIGYVTEHQAEKTISALNQKKEGKALVLRDGRWVVLKSSQLVVGDIIAVQRGYFVPADARIMKADSLTVDESILTGESMVVRKSTRFLTQNRVLLAERVNMLYKGTAVTGGSGRAIVIATGINTEMGKIQKMMENIDAPTTPIQKEMDQLGTHFVQVSLILCGGVFFLGLLQGKAFSEMFHTSMALAIAAIPEGLPTVAITTLAKGVASLKEDRVSVRHLGALEAMGAVHQICLDKTGTITLDKMELMTLAINTHRYPFPPNHLPHGDELNSIQLLLEICLLNNEIQIKEQNGEIKGSATEKALVEAAHKLNLDIIELNKRYPRSHTIHRAENRNYMITHHTDSFHHRFSTIKGNAEEVISLCRHYINNKGEIYPLNREMRSTILQIEQEMANSALRVLGVATKNHPLYKNIVHEHFVWIGLMGLKDFIKPGIKELLQSFRNASIRPIMITGDTQKTALAIGKIIEISGKNEPQVINADNLNQLDENELEKIVSTTDIFSRVCPADKLKIIQILQKSGRIVAMTGDGINDGPAIKSANVGITLGNGGTDVAREVSDVVLLDDDLQSILHGISEGRTVAINIKKTVEFLMATNASEILISFIPLLWGGVAPCNPMQLLWINLIGDIFPELALASDPPPHDILERSSPIGIGQSLLIKEDYQRVFMHSLFLTLSSLLSYGWGLIRYQEIVKAQTLCFNTVNLSQILYALESRSSNGFILKSILSTQKNAEKKVESNPRFKWAMASALALQISANIVPHLRSFLRVSPLSINDYLIMLPLAISPLLLSDYSNYRSTRSQRDLNKFSFQTSNEHKQRPFIKKGH